MITLSKRRGRKNQEAEENDMASRLELNIGKKNCFARSKLKTEAYVVFQVKRPKHDDQKPVSIDSGVYISMPG